MERIAQVVTDVEVMREVLYRFGARGEHEKGVKMAISLLGLLPAVLPVTRRNGEKAVELFSVHGPRGVPARDAIHLAVMEREDIKSTDTSTTLKGS